MTAKDRISKNKPRADRNICEGQPKNVFLGQVEFFGIEGFEPQGGGKWLYQWPPIADFPSFRVSVENNGITIAKHGNSTIVFIDIEAADIKARLDDETFGIMSHDALDDVPIDWPKFEAEMEAEGMVIPF